MLGNHKVQEAKFKYHKIDGFICFRLNHTLKIALLINISWPKNVDSIIIGWVLLIIVR